MSHTSVSDRFFLSLTGLGFCLALVAPPQAAHAQDPFFPGDENAQVAPAESSGESDSTGFDFLPSSPNDDFGMDLGMGGMGFESEGFDFEKSPEALEQEARKEAFDAALQGLLPLKPEEIRSLLEYFDRTQESVELPVYPPPKPVVAVETLAMDPGTKPTTIKVSHGYVTTLNIVDATGAPWPIEDITWAGDFEIIEFAGESTNHFIRISPQSEFAYGNMSVHMLGLQTPIIISLETSRDVVHYRFDAIVPKTGPMAETPIIGQAGGITTKAGDIDMASVLEGSTPESAAKLKVSGVDGRTTAYKLNGMTYLRTPLTLLSPAWKSSASSADGMHVYALNETPVILLSDGGKMVRARLSDREDILDE